MTAISTCVTAGAKPVRRHLHVYIARIVQICEVCRNKACGRSQILYVKRHRMESSKQQQVTESDMNKIFIALMVIFFLGDPGMETIAWLGEMKNYVVATALALISMPYVVSQIDG